MHGWDRALLTKMTTFDKAVHLEIEQEQVRHVTDEYTEERVASLMAKVEAARRYWDWNGYKVNT